jgi:SAM-dependent methyltransferase
MTEWFEQWFGEAYLRLYEHRDDEDADHLTGLIGSVVPLAGCSVLDLGCGPGRHAAQFRRRGARVIGYDLSMPLLSRAHHRGSRDRLPVVRGDMRRLPFRTDAFDVAVNLFTSFGYFADDAQHRLVVQEAARTLHSGGTFVLDYLNADDVRRTLVPHEERQIGTQQVAIDRSITDSGRFVVKEIRLADTGRSVIERVRLFAPIELEALVSAAGLTVTHRFGGYGGDGQTEPGDRVILVAKKR